MTITALTGMKPGPIKSTIAGAALATTVFSAPLAASADQDSLQPVINASNKVLEFDWPILRVGTGEYSEGPTGVTVFHFARKVFSAIDVRGGGPGTVNAPYMELGYDYPELDTVVFAGGSWYGLETVTAVASALKDDGIRDGNAFGEEPNIAMSVGSIIFDFGSRRLNEIYPDKRLAQAVFRATKPGIFPLGAYGAGRFTRSGSFFGCNAYSGQGGSYRKIGELKIAAFVVVNAVGVVTRRDGIVAACYGAPGWSQDVRVTDLFAEFPKSRQNGRTGVSTNNDNTKNTTISLIVTNRTLSPAELKRLAVQVHTSMARAIQPFATINDGDVLYAVSTAEDIDPVMPVSDLGVMASEVMWDAILSSVPDQPVAETPASGPILSEAAVKGLAGDFEFSQFVSVRISASGNRLFAQATSERDAYAIERIRAVELMPVSATDFMVPGRYPLTLRFDRPDRLVINPGHWQQIGTRKP